MSKTKKIFYSVASVVLLLLTILSIVLIVGIVIKDDINLKAAQVTITVDKKASVTVYVYGEHVNLYSSTIAEDVYLVEENSSVSIRAVSETKIFSSWSLNINGTESTSDDVQYTFTATGATTIGTNVRDAESTDLGRFMYNRFVISEPAHLLAVEKILAFGADVKNTDTEIIAEYDKLFSSYPGYVSMTATEKATIIQNDFFERVQTGHFLVSNNLSLFSDEFKGIGTPNNPFLGVMCGENGSTTSTIISTISDDESTGSNYYGLFGYLGNSAVVRNLSITTSIGIQAVSATGTNNIIYAGGVAGYIDNALLYNVTAKARYGIEVNTSTVYAGGIAGYFEGGLSSVNNTKYDGTGTNWIITNSAAKANYVGLVAGYANGAYLRDFAVITTSSVVGLSSTSTSGNNYLGSLYGYFNGGNNSKDTIIEDIKVTSSNNSQLQSIIDNGNSYVGGLIGYVNASSYDVTIGNISFVNTSSNKSEFISQSLDNQSSANVYAGGLFAYVEGDNLTANADFKESIYTTNVDGKEVYHGDYIFSGNYKVSALQNGVGSSDLAYGKCISAGLVARGYFNIGNATSSTDTTYGLNTENSEVLISDNSGLLEVIATQSSTTTTVTNTTIVGDIEHCIASLTFGLISNNSKNITISNIDVYADNVLVNAIREIGSDAVGDLKVAGFLGYSSDTSFEDVNLYINSSNFKLDSLSYDVQNAADDGNSAYCSGLFADVEGSSTNPSHYVRNAKVSGYNQTNFSEVGTTLKINSIQNTVAGGGDYKGENYVGGIIGQTWQTTIIDGLVYNGSESSEDSIILQGHENPDSCFCGGLIGLIKGDTNYGTVNITNCKVKNATVYAYATNYNQYDSPDIMLGGAVGACYSHEGVSTSFTDVRVYNSIIVANAYEKMECNVGGIMGAATWSGNHDFKNCYVYGSTLEANSSKNVSTTQDACYIGGILGHAYYATSDLYNCAVIDSNITATCETETRAIACGLLRQRSNSTAYYDNCYVNSNLIAGTTYKFGNIGNEITTQSDYSYYTSNVLGNEADSANETGIYEIGSFSSDIGATPTTLSTSVMQIANGNKVYPILRRGTAYTVNNVSTINAVSVQLNSDAVMPQTDILDIWVNVTASGNTTQNPSLMDSEAAHDAGWFLITSVNLISGGFNLTDVDNINSTLDIDYVDESNRYDYDSEDSEGKRYLHHEDDPTVIIRSGYQETVTSLTATVDNWNFTIIRDINIKVYEGIHDTEFKFTVDNMPIYEVVIFDINGNIINKNPNALDEYGTYSLTYTQEDTKTNYTFTYVPNPELEGTEPLVFFVAFRVGASNAYDNSAFMITIEPNVRKLVGVTLADYSPSLNGRDEDKGTSTNPYLLKNGSITKFIPVFTRVNDIEYIEYTDDTNVEYVNYSLSGGADTLKSSGELTINDDADTIYGVTLTSKIDPTDTQTVYYKCANTTYTMSYNATGADINGLAEASNECDYYFDILVYNNYSSLLQNFVVTIGGTRFTGYNVYADGTLIKGTADAATIGLEDVNMYTIVIPMNSINGNINISATFKVVYDVTLDLNIGNLNQDFKGDLTKTFSIPAGTSFNAYFASKQAEIDEWVKSATLFGYAFNDFYLVDNADSLPSYGNSLTDFTKEDANVTATSSLTFYGCWSFLIEIIEAPGTHIVTSFADSFMKDFYEEDLVTETIKIPINSNRGYVFTITKDSEFVGEAEVRAFSLTKDKADHINSTEILVEKYHENQYLYYIPPESITGYLVVATSVGNSEIIVGENTASVTEELLPEDGIYTFKYVVNHRNEDGDKSFIYNSGNSENPNSNLSLNRDVMVEFFEQTFDGNSISETARHLVKGTIVEVYYHLYVEGELTNTIVGSYVVDNDTTTKVFLKDFKLVNNDTNAFPDISFGELLGNHKSVSEVYYFSITPPNGVTLESNKIKNYMVHAGYYHYDNGQYRYVEGVRSGDSFINKPIDGKLENEIMHETALHQRIYSVSPSRDTELTLTNKDDLTFNFKDITNYEIFNMTVTNSAYASGYMNLSGTIGSRSIVTSSQLGFYINQLKFNAGFNTGEIDIYGRTDSSDWVLLETVAITAEVYQEYSVKFDGNYNYFRIDNTSGNEIHINYLEVTDKQTALPYSIDFTQEVNSLISGTDVTYKLVNEIKGDVRHDGKYFILAVQFFNEKVEVINSLDPSISLLVNGNTYIPNVDTQLGKNVLYFDLSEIIEQEGTEEIDLQLIVPSTYDNYEAVLQLKEASLSLKPAMAEVRGETINLLSNVKVTYIYKYMGNAESSGTVVNGNSTLFGTDTLTLTQPTDGELVFGGWYKDEALTDKVLQLEKADGNITIYGAFYPKGSTIHTLTFNYYKTDDEIDNPTGRFSDALIENGTVKLPELPADGGKVGYSFAGWSDGINTYLPGDIYTMGTSDVTLNAVITINYYTVTFNTNGGDPIQSLSYAYGASVAEPANPSKTGYTFKAWDVEFPFTMPAQNITVTAEWIPYTYTIVFNPNNGSSVTDTQLFTYGVEQMLDPNVFTYEEHEFIGWGIASDSTMVTYTDGQTVKNLTSTNNEVIQLYALWRVKTYTLKFDSNGGTPLPSIISGHKGADITGEIEMITKPTKVGYTFAGWDLDGDGNVETSYPNEMPGKDVVAVAVWTPRTDTKYTVEYYIENLDGTYTLAYTDSSLIGTTDSVVSASTDSAYVSSIITNATYYDLTTIASNSITSGSVLPDGSLILKVYYNRKLVYVTFESGGDWRDSITITADYNGDGTADVNSEIEYNSTNSVSVKCGATITVTYTAGSNSWWFDYTFSVKGDSTKYTSSYSMEITANTVFVSDRD